MNLNDFKFVAVWEFWVHAGDAERFEAVYGPSGAWAKLFASDPAYGELDWFGMSGNLVAI